MKSLKNELKNIVSNLGYTLKKDLIKLSGGFSNFVYEAKTNKGNLIIKVEKYSDEDISIEKTVYFMKKMYKIGAIKQKVIAFQKTEKNNYLIIEKVEGDSLHNLIKKGELNKKEVYDIIKDAIKTSKKISTIKVKGYGWIIKKDDNFVGWHKTEWDSVIRTKNELELLEKKKLKNNEFTKKIMKLINDNKKLFNHKDSRFVFLDLHFGNIIVKNKKFNGLIDTEWITFGDPIKTFTAITSDLFNTYEKSKLFDDPTIRTRYKKEVLKAMNLSNKKIKKLMILTIISNLDAMRYFFLQAEKKDKNVYKYSLGKIKKINPKAKQLYNDYLYHKESIDALLNIIK
jgi:aminoglycoside phosphotransferase (APT) family kinase protein